MELAAAEVRGQIDRILRSKALEGSDVHRKLLAYLAEKTLAGEAERVKEYTVALDALGKPPTYDPRHDSVVRIQIGRLRVKMGEYYQSEGVADPILITLPKGGFKLSFQKTVAPQAPVPSPLESKRLVYVLLLCLVLLSAWGLYAAFRIRTLSQVAAPVEQAWNAELTQLWAPFLETRRPLLICIGAPMFLQYPSLAFVRDPGANSWDQLESSPRYSVIRKGLGNREPVPWYSFTGVGEASSALALGELLGTRRRDILLTRSNLLSWPEIVDTNLVFVGPPKFNTQLQSIPIREEVRLESDGMRILNPRAGEPSFLKDKFRPGAQFEGVTHALISRTPGLSGQGDLLLLGGNASADTFAATQWVTQPWRAAELLKHLRDPSGGLPKYFQAVIRVQFKNGTPVESSYVLHRVLQSAKP
jgi:hypothetical protein